MNADTEYTQVTVWPGTTLGGQSPESFEQWVKAHFDGVRVKHLKQITTLPGDGGEGGREDLVFAVHKDDVMKFAVPRLGFGMRWIEDVIANERINTPGKTIYPQEFHDLARTVTIDDSGSLADDDRDEEESDD